MFADRENMKNVYVVIVNDSCVIIADRAKMKHVYTSLSAKIVYYIVLYRRHYTIGIRLYYVIPVML